MRPFSKPKRNAMSLKPCCPTCGRAWPKAKAAPVSGDIATMTTAQLYAQYKKTAPIEDVRFALRIGADLSPGLRDDWQALLGIAPTLTRAETYRRLKGLQQRWRQERKAA